MITLDEVLRLNDNVELLTHDEMVAHIGLPAEKIQAMFDDTNDGCEPVDGQYPPHATLMIGNTVINVNIDYDDFAHGDGEQTWIESCIVNQLVVTKVYTTHADEHRFFADTGAYDCIDWNEHLVGYFVQDTSGLDDIDDLDNICHY